MSIVKYYPFNVKCLLFISFALTVAKAIVMPLLAVYFASSLKFSQDVIGIIVGGGIFLGALFGIYGGFLVDRLSKQFLLVSGLFILINLFAWLSFTKNAVVLLCILTALNFLLLVIDVLVKTSFSITLAPAVRLKAFSIKYILANIGYAVGPMVGAYLVICNIHLPFYIAASICSGLFILTIVKIKQLSLQHINSSANKMDGFVHSLMIIGHDKRLLLFSLGGMLSAIVYDSFSAYLAQYLSVIYPRSSITYHMIASLVATNAIVVISLQYFIGQWLNGKNLLRWIVVGTVFFIIGQLGFAFAKSTFVWLFAMVIFSLGEIIIIPAEYLLIDLIAPEGLKGSYFGVQNINRIGGAFGPIICGFVLNLSPYPNLIFYIFILLTIVGTCFYQLGNKYGAVINTIEKNP